MPLITIWKNITNQVWLWFCIVWTVFNTRTTWNFHYYVLLRENHLINYLMLFVSGTHILSNRSSPPKVPFKKGTQKIFAKSTGKQLCHRLPFNKDKTPAHVFSCEICETLKNIPPNRAPPGAAAAVTHILKITELPPGLEKNSITNYVDLCCFHVLHLLFSLYTRHGVTRKRNTKRLRHTGNLFRKNLQLKDVC